MESSSLGLWLAHGQVRAHSPDPAMLDEVERRSLAPLRFVDDAGRTNDASRWAPHVPERARTVCRK
jgi:phosphoribosylformylglycinamidine synthase